MKKSILIILCYTTILFLSSILYRQYFNINHFANYFEIYLLLLIFVSIFYFSKLKITQFIIFLLFSFAILGNNLHYAIYHSWLSPTNMLLFLKELKEVSRAALPILKESYIQIIWGTIDIFIFLSLRFFVKNKYVISDIILYLVLSYMFARAYNTSSQFHYLFPDPAYPRIKNIVLSTSYLTTHLIPDELLGNSSIPDYHSEIPRKISPPKRKNIILIMGESLSSKHIKDFGYDRETTPFLTNQHLNNHNIIFKEAYSGGVFTALSLPMFFNAIPEPNGLQQITKGTTNLFKLAKEQGYQTHFYSAQPEDSMLMINFLGEKWIDDLMFPTNLGYKRDQGMNDAKLLPLFKKLDFNSPQFIVLHKRGSHQPYGEYLTQDEKIFKGNTPLNNYDNTILSTDNFIKKVISQLRNKNIQDWTVIYTSDHGQQVKKDFYNQGTLEEDNYLVPLYIESSNKSFAQQNANIFHKCNITPHYKISTFILNSMGYNIKIGDCNTGTILQGMLSGDTGYLKLKSNSELILISNGS